MVSLGPPLLLDPFEKVTLFCRPENVLLVLFFPFLIPTAINRTTLIRATPSRFVIFYFFPPSCSLFDRPLELRQERKDRNFFLPYPPLLCLLTRRSLFQMIETVFSEVFYERKIFCPLRSVGSSFVVLLLGASASFYYSKIVTPGFSPVPAPFSLDSVPPLSRYLDVVKNDESSVPLPLRFPQVLIPSDVRPRLPHLTSRSP